MSVFAAIPVKKLQKSKTRLSEVLTPRERRVFTLAMLEDVLRAVVESPEVHQIVVIGSDAEVQEVAENFGATYLLEERPGLNRAVEQAINWCIQNEARSVLILLADVPLITRRDVDRIVHMGSEVISLVLAPSRNRGTNTRFQRPPNLIPLRYGRESFNRHLAEASVRNIIAKVYASRTVMMDIDSPRNLEDLLKTDAQTASHRFLRQIDVDTRLKRGSRIL